MINIGAVILAAGLSSRMGQPKMLLQWKNSTVIETVVHTVMASTLQKIVVVTGSHRDEIKSLLELLPVELVFNPDFANGEMLVSFQKGLRALSDCDAAMLFLGDQPQIQIRTVEQLIADYSGQAILIPSYNMKRGHPWIINQNIWNDIFSLHPPQSLRDFVKLHQAQIHYIDVDAPEILQDMDTAEDYHKLLKHQSGQKI